MYGVLHEFQQCSLGDISSIRGAASPSQREQANKFAPSGMGRGSNLALTPSRFQKFLAPCWRQIGNASLDPNSFSTRPGHKHTRGYPGSMQKPSF